MPTTASPELCRKLLAWEAAVCDLQQFVNLIPNIAERTIAQDGLDTTATAIRRNFKRAAERITEAR